jgi:cell fate regulator YaaT (PSP1 superfamily)
MDQQESAQSATANLVGVRLLDVGRVHCADAGRLVLASGDQVIVQTEQGNMLCTVTAPPRVPTELDAGVLRVIKKADAGDIARHDKHRVREREALRICWHRVHERRLRMKLIKAEQVFDGGKIIFYFAAEGRVDFRDLVRDLAHTLRARIEMKQIGPRDEAKLIGAVGPCGRELCCSTWLHEPGGVSVKMARAQGLSLNPSKLAGMCGRLKCCLRYEYDTYLELGRQLPTIGARVVSVKGDGVVTRQNILQQTVTIRREDGGEVEATREDLVEKKA